MSIATSTIQFGKHYMLDGYGADPALLQDATALKKILEEIPPSMGMHTISEPVVMEVGPKNRKDPGGFSGFVLIAESHMSFHTFPKRGFITIDVYTCQDEIDSERLTQLFTRAFSLKSHEVHLIDRGTKYPAENLF